MTYLPNDAPSLHAVVRELPKQALIEKQVVFYKETVESPVINSSEYGETSNYRSLVQEEVHLHYTTWGSKNTKLCSAVICGKGIFNAEVLTKCEGISRIVARAISVRVFYRIGYTAQICFKNAFGANSPALTTIPCRSLMSPDFEDCDFALVMLGVHESTVS